MPESKDDFTLSSTSSTTEVDSLSYDDLITTDFEHHVKRNRSGSRISSTAGPFSFPFFDPCMNPGAEASDAESDTLVTEEVNQDRLHKNLFYLHQPRIRENPIEFAKQLGAWAGTSGWRSYQNYIGGRIMYEGYSASCIERIVNSAQVKTKVDELARSRLARNLEAAGDSDPLSAEERAVLIEEYKRELFLTTEQICKVLVTRMDSVRFLRFFGAGVNLILARMYHQGIHISLEEYSRFRKVALIAHEKKQPLFIVPCHKSHIDYLTISWLFMRLGLSLPHIIAGDNLNLPIIGNWLSKCGAVFIKRSFSSEDPLYPTVVKEYIEELLASGMTLECFIEGTRSRIGKVLTPKLGILKYVVDALLNGRTDDVWICPISLQYDKVIETESYVRELLGNPKEKETLFSLLQSHNVIQLRLGRIDARFQEPFSLKEFVAKHQITAESICKPSNSVPNAAPIPGSASASGRLLKSLGYKILSDINDVSVIMPASLVGTVLLTIRGRGIGRSELIERVTWLRGMIESRGGRVVNFEGMELEHVVDKALSVLKGLIGEVKKGDVIEPTFFPQSPFELSFYRNQVIHLFVSEAIASVSLYTSFKGKSDARHSISYADMRTHVSFISDLFRNEFVYGTDGLERNFAKTMARLERDGVVSIENECISLSAAERRSGRQNYDFFCFLLWPFVEVYWLATVSLFSLVTETGVIWCDFKLFKKAMQLLGKTLFYQGDISYLEAINQATLDNAYYRLSEMGVIVLRNVALDSNSPKKMTKVVGLNAAFSQKNLIDFGESPSELTQLLDHISAFRREGKSRRDTPAVDRRIFEYCQKVRPPIVQITEDSEGQKILPLRVPTSEERARL